MMGAGKPMKMLKEAKMNVFETIRPKNGLLKNWMKYLNPTHGLWRTPSARL